MGSKQKMLIAKTELNRDALIAVQKHLKGKAKTNENDLVALNYLFEDDFREMIHYTFMWSFRFDKLQEYHSGRLQMICHNVIEDNIPMWIGLFTGTLGAWQEYCATRDNAFVTMVKEQLKDDGYTTNQIPCRQLRDSR